MNIIVFIFVTSLLVAGLMFAACIIWAIIGGIGLMLSDIACAFRDHFKDVKFFAKVRK